MCVSPCFPVGPRFAGQRIEIALLANTISTPLDSWNVEVNWDTTVLSYVQWKQDDNFNAVSLNTATAGRIIALATGRGLHSSTFWLNLSRFLSLTPPTGTE